MEQKSASKQAYVKPVIEDHGSVTDLTSVGETNPGADMRQGSVMAPGLNNKPR